MRHILAIALTAGCWSGNAAPPAKAPAPAPAKQPRRTDDLAHKTYKQSWQEVWTATVDATRANYPNVEAFEKAGEIKTAWHSISPPLAVPGKRYFARFDIRLDGPPSSIHIVGRISEWRTGDAMPSELTGPELAWLEPRIAELRSEIDRRLTGKR
jgi:hypothetical protein